MGLISGLLTLPLAPVRGVVAVAEQVQRQAEEEFYDPQRVRAELQQVAALREQGLITDAEAEAWEDELVDRLLQARDRNGGGH